MAGAEAKAAFMEAAVTVVPFETVLQALVTHCVLALLMFGAPTFDQLIAREDERTLDHGYWPYENPGKQRRKMTKMAGDLPNLNINSPAESKSGLLKRLYLWSPSLSRHRSARP